MPNGDKNLYEQIQDSYKRIGNELDSEKRLDTKHVLKSFLETQQLIMSFFIGTFLEDHKKVESMWIGYRFMLGVSSVLGVSIIGLIWALITGQVELLFK